jgi:hypothetical protein
MSKRTIATFAIPLILVLSVVSTIQPVRAIGMNLWTYFQNWNICVGGKGSTGNVYLYSNTGPSSKTWVVIVSIGLNGGDNTQYAIRNTQYAIRNTQYAIRNTQYAYFAFDMIDGGSGNFVGEYGANQYNWIAQGIVFSSTMTASLAGSMSLLVNISNPDSVSQCFSVQATSWYY